MEHTTHTTLNMPLLDPTARIENAALGSKSYAPAELSSAAIRSGNTVQMLEVSSRLRMKSLPVEELTAR
jgi:hypothetical protein